MQHLLVYGTLGPGRPNAYRLENMSGTWHEGYVFGQLLQ